MFNIVGLFLLFAVSMLKIHSNEGHNHDINEPAPLPQLFWLIKLEDENLALNGAGVNVIAVPYNTQDPNRYSQHWVIFQNTDGSRTLVNAINQYCMQPQAIESLSNVIVSPCDRNELQDWYIKDDGTISPKGNSTYVLYVQPSNNVALELESNSDIDKIFEVKPADGGFC